MLNQFQSLNQFLIEHQAYWRFEPFFLSDQQSLPWLTHSSALCGWLESLSPEQIASYKQDNASLLNDMSCYLPCLEQISGWTALPQIDNKGLELARGVESGVPGRKLAQILSMGEAAINNHHGNEWLEWCSGCLLYKSEAADE
mgnify:FL=1